MELSHEQLERYSRHINVDEFGLEGQKKLLNAKVLVIGSGGLGSPALMYLGAAGIGTIGIVDDDVVDYSNLQRQVIHQTKDVGVLKTESAKNKVNALNPDVKVNIYNTFVTKENILDIIKDYDFILDCTDNFNTKFLINDACVIAKKPFCHGAVIRFLGQVMTYVPNQGPCYRCIFEREPEKDSLPSNKALGVLGPLPGVIGCIQALEAIKYIVGIGDLLIGRMYTIDGLTMVSRTMKLPKHNCECAVCGQTPSILSVKDSF